MHMQLDESSCSRVHADLFCRISGAGQDELTFAASIIYRMADIVPESGLGLPFINQPGSGAIQQGGRVNSHQRGYLRVAIDLQDALRLLLGRLRLTAGFRTFDQDCAGNVE